MKLPFDIRKVDTGLVVSVIAHAAFFIWGIVSFSARPLEAKPTDSLPVDIISSSQFSELTKGLKTGKKDATNKEQVEKLGDSKPVEEAPTSKLTEKKEIKTAAAEPTPQIPLDQQKVEIRADEGVGKPADRLRRQFVRNRHHVATRNPLTRRMNQQRSHDHAGPVLRCLQNLRDAQPIPRQRSANRIPDARESRVT